MKAKPKAAALSLSRGMQVRRAFVWRQQHILQGLEWAVRQGPGYLHSDTGWDTAPLLPSCEVWGHGLSGPSIWVRDMVTCSKVINTAWSQKGQGCSLDQLCLLFFLGSVFKGRGHIWCKCNTILKSSHLVFCQNQNCVASPSFHPLSPSLHIQQFHSSLLQQV